MYRIFKSFLVTFLFCTVFVSSVQAEVFLFEDRQEHFTITFPDAWKRVTNQKADDRITIAGPGANDHAICRVRVNKDRRFVIFPGKFDSDIQKISYSRDFWNGYLGEYNDVVVDIFKDESQLGRGYASMAEATYDTVEGAPMRKRGVMFASLYHDRLYVAECSSEESFFYKWRPAFLSIVKSIDFENVRQPNARGHYRAFDGDDKIEVQGATELDVYKF